MGRGGGGGKEEEEGKEGNNVDVIWWVYMGALLLWGIWILFHIPHFIALVSAFIFFQTANLLIRFSASPHPHPLFVNTAVSLLHSALSSSSVVFILVTQWRANPPALSLFQHHQLVANAWPSAYTALSFSSGYFAYDQWDMLHHRLYSPSILAHHFLLLLCFSLALYRNITINYLILTLICELHSVFLHLRKLRRMAGVRSAESRIVKLEWVLNWATFILARLIPHALILIKLVRDASKFDKGIQLPLAFFGMLAMNALNIGLGIDLFAAYKRETTH